MCPLCFTLTGYDPSPQACYAQHIAWHQALRSGQDVATANVDLPPTSKGEVYELTVTWDAPMPGDAYEIAPDPQEKYQTVVEVLTRTPAAATLRVTAILDWTSEPRQARFVASSTAVA